ncbi:TRADD-N-associated membrane domain-containing protein [Mycobacterium terramassiliense]|uniref:TRADD-N-associated membrane domain-containing protein n=1 Tax=Mycobacterium terramassiliense TaxID=1841859 RepID=UPI003CCBC64A
MWDGTVRVRPVPGEIETRGGARPPSAEVRERSSTTPDQRLLDAVAGRASTRFKIQEAHYANALRQSTTYFYVSLLVGLVGFALLMAGVALALADSVQVGTVTSLGGLLTDGAAALIFNQANRAKSDAQSNLKTIAHAAERDESNLMAFILASRIDDDGIRDATHADLARQLIIATSAPTPQVPQDGPSGSTGDDD